VSRPEEVLVFPNAEEANAFFERYEHALRKQWKVRRGFKMSRPSDEPETKPWRHSTIALSRRLGSDDDLEVNCHALAAIMAAGEYGGYGEWSKRARRLPKGTRVRGSR
jgi:hypothetical protein